MMFGFELQIHFVEVFQHAALMVSLIAFSRQERLRSEYGFLFTRKGRCLFILFIGILNFGIEYSALSKVVGFGTIVNAIFNYMVMMVSTNGHYEIAS